MGSRGLVVVVLLLVAVAALPPAARAVNPAISNTTWTPWVPAHGEQVTVEADVVSPGGTPTVTASWCVVPPFTCIPFTMTDAGGGHYRSPPITAAGPPYTGAHFNVSAVDPGGNYSFTFPEIYVQFASTIMVGATLVPASPTPGQSVSVSGTAIYENNSSVPAKFSRVDFRIPGTPSAWSTTTDGAGAFTSSFSAPTTVEAYALNITVSNRTISGSRERPFNVARGPTPDLAVVQDTISVSPSPAVAGQTVTLSFFIENRGTANATAFTVQVNVSGPAGLAHARSFSIARLPQGVQQNLSDSWVATEGSWAVTITVDYGNQISEISESNNQGGTSLSVAAAPREGPSVTLMVGLVIAVVGVAAAVAFVYRWRAGRRKGP